MKDEQLQQENAELKARLSNLESRSQNPTPDLSAPRSPNHAPGLSTPAPAFTDEELDLRELWLGIWQEKIMILVVTLLFSVCALIFALVSPNEYKSTVILTPSATPNSSSISKLAGQFGGLASLAGINVGGSEGEDKTVIALELMKTWGFLEKFIEDNSIQAEVFAVKGWSRMENQLIYDTDIYDPQNKSWERDFDIDEGERAEPSSWELYEEFRGRVDISQDKNNGLVSITIEYFSPILAKQWVEKLVKQINAHMKMKDKAEAEKSIGFLKAQIGKTDVTDMQAIFYQLIEEQVQKLMLTEVSDEYVLKTISPSKIAEEESKPNRILITVLGILLGLTVGFIVAWFKFIIFSKPNP